MDRGLDAVEVVREAAAHVGGGGGGRPTMAAPAARIPRGLRDALRSGQAERSLERADLKVLALDYGSARTGVAVSDPTGTLARPLCVVERAGDGDGLARLARARREHEAPSASSSACR